jgi:hypothetical protein
MANTIDAGLQLDVVLDTIFTAFKRAIAPLKTFSTVFSDVPLKGSNEINVAYYPLVTTASAAFATTYSALAHSTATQIRTVNVNKRMAQVISFTSAERARQPFFDPVKHGTMMAEKLVFDVMADILSVVTAANYAGSTIAASASTAFDENDVADLAQKCMEDFWPAGGRGLVLNPAFWYAVVRRPLIIQVDQHGNTTGQTEGDFARLLGFDAYGSAGVPVNGAEKIAGFAALPSAILVASAPIPPAPAVRDVMADYRMLSDGSGLALEYRMFGNADTDTAYQSVEFNYGYAVGEGAALKRITTP